MFHNKNMAIYLQLFFQATKFSEWIKYKLFQKLEHLKTQDQLTTV